MAAPIIYTKQTIFNFLSDKYPTVNWKQITSTLPELIYRSKWNRIAKEFNLPYTQKSLAEMDRLGTGPIKYQKKEKEL